MFLHAWIFCELKELADGFKWFQQVFEKLGPSLYDFLRKNSYRSFPIDLVRELGRQLLESVACVWAILAPFYLILSTWCSNIFNMILRFGHLVTSFPFRRFLHFQAQTFFFLCTSEELMILIITIHLLTRFTCLCCSYAWIAPDSHWFEARKYSSCFSRVCQSARL